MTGQTELAADPDEPFSGIILVPLNSIPVVHRELVVEVVITLANGHESSDEMVSGRVLVIERRVT